MKWHEGMNCDEYEETVGKRWLEELELREALLETVSFSQLEKIGNSLSTQVRGRCIVIKLGNI